MRLKILILIFGSLLFFPACSTLHKEQLPPSGSNFQAKRFIENVSRINNKLETFQGVGKFRLRNKQGALTSRIAWIGAKNGKLRIEVLGPAGRSQASFAADGKWFYAITRNPIRFHKVHSKNASLNSLISIPIKTDDLRRLLAGKIPVYPHHSVFVRPDRSGNGYVLVLKKRWMGTVEKIFLDNTGSKVRKLEVFSAGGTLAYSVVFQDYRVVQGYRVPSKLLISDAADVTFDLEIQKFNADIKLADSAFVLESLKVKEMKNEK